MRAIKTQALKAGLAPVCDMCGCTKKELNALASAIAKLSPVEALRINPVALAARFALDEEKTLSMFVCGAKCGVFDFGWGMVCPLCGAVTHNCTRLDGLAEESFYCAFCDKEAPSRLDDTIEVHFSLAGDEIAMNRFDPHKNFDSYLRYVISGSYPLFETWRGYHGRNTAARALIEPDEEKSLEFTPRPGGLYRLICLDNHSQSTFLVSDSGNCAAAEPQEVSLALNRTEFSSLRHHLDSAPTRIKVLNSTGWRVWVTLLFRNEKEIIDIFMNGMPAPLPRLTGARLLNNQKFRDLFGFQNLVPDLKLKIRNLTLLFTDLKGSTELYARVGDLSAYKLVQDHFHLLRDAVGNRRGAVVKTMGDAVMASFSHPLDAVMASLDMLGMIESLNARIQPEGIGLKIGLHCGPALMVNAGSLLDYFGQTVNVAARVQGLAGAGEICLTEALDDALGVRDALNSKGFYGTREMAELKGVSGVSPVYRYGYAKP